MIWFSETTRSAMHASLQRKTRQNLIVPRL